MVEFLLWQLAESVVCGVGVGVMNKMIGKKALAHKKVVPVDLVCHSPGRIRIRIPAIKNDPDCAATIEQELACEKWVHEVKANPITGTLLVIYDEGKASPRAVEHCAQLGLAAAVKHSSTKSQKAGNGAFGSSMQLYLGIS